MSEPETSTPESESSPETELVALDPSNMSGSDVAYLIFVVASVLASLPLFVRYWRKRHHHVLKKRFPRLVMVYAVSSVLMMIAMFFARSDAFLAFCSSSYQAVFFVAYHQRTMRVLDRWEVVVVQFRNIVLTLSAVVNVSFWVVANATDEDVTTAHRVFNLTLLLPMLFRIRMLADSLGVRLESTYGMCAVIGSELLARGLIPAVTSDPMDELTFWIYVICLVSVVCISIGIPLVLARWDDFNKEKAKSEAQPSFEIVVTQAPFEVFAINEGYAKELRFYQRLAAIGSPVLEALANADLRPQFDTLACKEGMTFDELVLVAEKTRRALSEHVARRFVQPSIVRRMSQAAASLNGSRSSSRHPSRPHSRPHSATAKKVYALPAATLDSPRSPLVPGVVRQRGASAGNDVELAELPGMPSSNGRDERYSHGGSQPTTEIDTDLV